MANELGSGLINAIKRLGSELTTPLTTAEIIKVITKVILAFERATFKGCAGILSFNPSKAVNAIDAARIAGTRQKILLTVIIVEPVVGEMK